MSGAERAAARAAVLAFVRASVNGVTAAETGAHLFASGRYEFFTAHDVAQTSLAMLVLMNALHVKPWGAPDGRYFLRNAS